MQPDPTDLLRIAGIETPVVGFYDAPDPAPFEPSISPLPAARACVFAHYSHWLQGRTLHLQEGRFGCRGAGHWLGGRTSRSGSQFVQFLVDEEGLKSSHELMEEWLEHTRPYQQEHSHILVGPLQASQYGYLKTVSFFVNPDQLTLLMLGAQYHSAPGDPTPVVAPFGAGCMQLVALFDDLTVPQAVIGATDIAMRQYLPPDILAFTVTKPMFEQLCALDERSFLHKRFWARLQKARSRL